MQKSKSIQITWLQFVLLIHGTQVGVGFLTLPRELAKVAGTDGWISIILGGVLSVVASLFIIHAMKRQPEATLFDLFNHYFGKWVGKTASVIFLFYLIGGSLAIIFSIVSILRIWLMPKTPDFMLILLLAVPTYMIVHHGIKMIGRYAELIFYFSLWIIILLAFPLNHSHWLYLLPFIKEGWMPILSATRLTILSYLGFEITFILYPFLMNKKKAVSAVIVANTLTMLFYILTTLVCFSYFSSLEILQYTWPTLSLLKVIRVQFLDRWDVIFLAMYMIVISVTWIVYMSLAVFGVKQLIPKSKPSITTVVILLITLALSLVLDLSHTQVTQMTRTMSNIGIVIAYVFPLCLWGYVKLLEGIRRNHGGDSS
ncbi:GerAB/ArcD/ProY family transporter [Paenibacillus terrigena]|uniref:GerAB/ArcD/ProY family transporter n=1 Tax=Paenibacillus terrigena TaxID=369333 RepID=UPI0003625AD7|nr:GerAB/ArcD/ProY family transporter [Paenibacillus terrigena]